ncbi:MAG TPA: DUF885 family protein, partial [Candidatus Limnocylindrales bacterium]|nr:DUF885 family protein [Candidatus Limnocylindrales bacterium]
MTARLLPLVAFLPILIVLAIPSPARAQTPQQNLAKLCDEFWQGYLEANPTRATSLGDKRYDDRLDDITPRGISAERKRLKEVLARAMAIDEKTLSAQDRLTRSALVTEVEDHLAYISCGLYEWTVDPLGGPQVEFMDFAEYTTIDTPEDAARYVKRVMAMGPYIDDHIANLRTGKAEKKVAVRAAVQKTLDQLMRINATEIESLGVWKPAAAPHQSWSAAERERFAKNLGKAIESSLLPALERYRAFLDKEILPVSRPPERAG